MLFNFYVLWRRKLKISGGWGIPKNILILIAEVYNCSYGLLLMVIFSSQTSIAIFLYDKRFIGRRALSPHSTVSDITDNF